jgi:hydroxyacylglutathione hydrolase
MNMLMVQTGDLLVNTFIVHAENSKETVIIDPGGSPKKIKELVDKYELEPKAILLTHGHFDHIGAINALKEMFKLEVYIHEDDANMLIDENLNLSVFASNAAYTTEEADVKFKDGDKLSVCGITFDVLHTPGHTPGSSIFVVDRAVAFAGDTIFKRSIGRTDLPGGDMAVMQQSLSRLKTALNPKTQVFPGHGEHTVFEDELTGNPFLNAN